MLIALPLLCWPRIGDHVMGGRLVIALCLLKVSTQRVDARAKRESQSGNAYPLAGVMLLQIAPDRCNPQGVVPAVEAKVTLQLQAEGVELLTYVVNLCRLTLCLL